MDIPPGGAWLHLTAEEIELVEMLARAEGERPLGHRPDRIAALIKTLEEACDLPPNAEGWVQAARDRHQDDGEVEVDDLAVISLSEDGGAYVMAWVWVDDEDVVTR